MLADETHSLASRRLNPLTIAFKSREPQEPVVVGRLLAGRNAEPLIVGAEFNC